MKDNVSNWSEAKESASNRTEEKDQARIERPKKREVSE